LTVPKPIAESYWVEPGRFLAAEYPRSIGEAASYDKLRRILDAGVTLFVDLTHEADPLESYDYLLEGLRAKYPKQAPRHLSIPIHDMNVPRSPAVAARILDAIDDELEAGGVVYLHCWGGIGRTGTIVGCWLVRHGLGGEEAIERLNELWKDNPKRSWWPRIPQTEPQFEYIRRWSELDSAL
jgi:hypothetical protein